MSRLLHPYFQLLLTVSFITVSEIFLKRGAMGTARDSHDWLGLASLGSPDVWLGAGLLVLSFLTWVLVVRVLPLYLAFTLCSVIHVTIPVSSWLIFGDQISAIRAAGIALVLAGICLIARTASAIEERS
jgi:multidrug transporter EmrE-like cation transporter